EAARRIAAEDSRVQGVVHAQNRGHIATSNEGIGWGDQPYMLLLSADDMVAPGALTRAVTLMETHPKVAFVHGAGVRFSPIEELDRHGAGGDASAAEICRGGEFIRRLCVRSDNPIETPTAVV